MNSESLIASVCNMGIGQGFYPFEEIYSVHRTRRDWTVYWNKPDDKPNLGFEFTDLDQLIEFIRGQPFTATPIEKERE